MRARWRRSSASLASALLLLGSAALAPARAAEPDAPRWWHGELSLSTGLDWSVGDYGDPSDTELWYVPVSATYLFDQLGLTSYAYDQVELRVTVPYLRIDGPLGFFTDARGFTQLQRSEEHGLGDVLVRGSYIWFPPPGRRLPVVELTGKLKLPTADEDRGLGTGETDFSLQVDLSQRFGDVTPFVTLGYRFVGTPPGSRLDESWFGSVGATYRMNDWLSAGLLYNWFGAATPRRHDSHELIPYASLRVRDDLSLGPYAVLGLAGHTPDYGLGLTIRYRIPFR